MTYQFTLFDTALGCCALVWGERGIVGAFLPESDESAMRRRIARRFPEAHEAAPPPDVARTRDAIVALLSGDASDLSAAPLDMAAVPEFHRRVYDMARTIPPGGTLTYGDIAARLGDPLAARDVGEALGKNPFPIIVPCHRVVAAGGKLGGFSARGGVGTKRRMLAIESAHAAHGLPLFAGAAKA
jgi:methylated-DNA-[protein]-cysteine S-methyltransferase